MPRTRLLLKIGAVVCAAGLMAGYIILHASSNDPNNRMMPSSKLRPIAGALIQYQNPPATTPNRTTTLPLNQPQAASAGDIFAGYVRSGNIMHPGPSVALQVMEPFPAPRFVYNVWVPNGAPPEAFRESADRSPRPGLIAPAPPRYVFPEEVRLGEYRPQMLMLSSKSGAPLLSLSAFYSGTPATRPAGR